MTKNLQPVRGTHDVLAEESALRRWLVDTARNVAETYGYGEIAVPIFEFTEVFQRTLGEASDVVTKEMYTFEDRGGESITLRPEFTAGIARAFISGGLAQNLPLKFFTSGPVFRYERPQKGRMRQFHQIDCEFLGVSDPLADAEIVCLAAHILKALGVLDKTTLEINTLGDSASRVAYREALVKYFAAHKDKLSDDSIKRLEKNPLRILDSKDEGDRRIVANAPLMSEYLSGDAADYFARSLAALSESGVKYTVNEKLVRGLDYYCHVAFEFTTTLLGAQGTVLGGGRYDSLIETMGGPPTPATGFGAGIERLCELAEYKPSQKSPVVVAPVSPAEMEAAFKIAQSLRGKGIYAELSYTGNLKKRLMRADKLGASKAIIIGGDELASGKVTVRDMKTGEQELKNIENFT